MPRSGHPTSGSACDFCSRGDGHPRAESPGFSSRTFVDPENPTRVGLVMDIPDMEAVMAAMETEEARDAMAYDGVLPETLVFLVEA